MKHLIFIILCAALSLGFSRDHAGRLTIHSVPENVEVRIDSVLFGTTPLEQIELAPGPHLIEGLSPEAGVWNSENVVRTIDIRAGSDTTIELRFQKHVKINSIPYHAKLTLNNKILGFTPLSIPFGENRGKEFRMEKNGYNSLAFVLKNSRPHLFELQPIDMAENKPDLPFGYSLVHTRLKTKFLFLTGTVVTHWLSFYFKNVADDSYEKYSQTVDPRQMNKYWDKTRKYDRYSDITLGVSYALLSGLIYTVLWR